MNGAAEAVDTTGLGAAPPALDPRWKHVGPDEVKTLLEIQAFNDALRRGATQTNPNGEWRVFQYNGTWYGRRVTSRGTFFFRAPAGVAAPPPSDVHRSTPDMQKWAQVASPPPPGQLHPTSPHQNKWAPGTIAAPANPDLHRWGATKVFPASNSPNWRALTHAEMNRLGNTAGWAQAVTQAAAQRRGIWRFHNAWYKHGTNGQFYVLGPGSGGTTSRAFAGIPGLGDDGGTATTVVTELQAAQAMASALTAHGYRKTDMPIYETFQEVEGLNADGFPGTATMNALFSVLDANGIARPSVTVYPWLAGPGYDGVNAPLMSQWDPSGGTAPAPKSTTTVIVQPPAASKTSKALIVLGTAGVVGLGLIGWGVWRKSKRQPFIPRFAHA